MQSVANYFKGLVYPGRNIVVGRNTRGELFFTYAIMGRSSTSRNRVFKKDGESIKTEAFDPSIIMDPSLIIYNAVREFKNTWIVTNGNQTDTIYDAFSSGDTFENALDTREYEDDDPSWTPRISALVIPNAEKGKSILKMAILKNQNNHCRRFFYNYSEIEKDTAFIIQTYEDSKDPLVSFSKDPVEVSLDGLNTIDEISSNIFDSLNSDNRISLLGRNINTEKEIIINSRKK
ncbi:MAG: inosine monophosphate cyclohydrolase [Spirochaetaceae bacterium]|nr:inosine monophosphate cyclohydrolase [Spirochaetaceae bacterium]